MHSAVKTAETVGVELRTIRDSLHLPPDDINPWLDARLTHNECVLLMSRIAARTRERKPAAYITGLTYIQGIPFHVDSRVIIPRSYIGELLFSEAFAGGES